MSKVLDQSNEIELAQQAISQAIHHLEPVGRFTCDPDIQWVSDTLMVCSSILASAKDCLASSGNAFFLPVVNNASNSVIQ